MVIIVTALAHTLNIFWILAGSCFLLCTLFQLFEIPTDQQMGVNETVRIMNNSNGKDPCALHYGKITLFWRTNDDRTLDL